MTDLDWGTPYHIGIVVRDLDQAMARYGDELGVSEWRVRDLDGFRQPAHWHGDPMQPPTARLAFSAPSLPAFELIQPTNDVEWSATTFLRDHGEGVYHVGYWVDDIRAALQRADELGIEAELVSIEDSPDGGLPTGFAYLAPGPAGLRAELVSVAGKDRMLRWIRTGATD